MSIFRILLSLSLGFLFLQGCKNESEFDSGYDVAAFYWPAYHFEPRAEFLFPEKRGEWEIIAKSRPKEEGHNQPRVPLWGYLDEANPKDMDIKISSAIDHGVNLFIFDWYWYRGEPFLESCLDEGFLPANNNRMKFYLMWANHDATTYWDQRTPSFDSIIWDGEVDRAQFDILTTRIIDKYFTHPAYYKIEGEPVFCIYELNTLINGLGGAEATRDALDSFREKCRKAGFPGLHLQSILWSALPSSIEGVPGDTLASQEEVLHYFGFKSLTNYCWAHLQNPDGDYEKWAEASTAMWDDFSARFSIPYLPNVTVGWDANPRFAFKTGYINNPSPEKFAKYVRKAKAYLYEHPEQPQILTINAWNEWSEGSYLEPDSLHGYGFLQALKEALKDDR